MIQAKFGLEDIAIRTLDVMSMAVLEATLSCVGTQARTRCDGRFGRKCLRGYRSIVALTPNLSPTLGR